MHYNKIKSEKNLSDDVHELAEPLWLNITVFRDHIPKIIYGWLTYLIGNYFELCVGHWGR